MCIGECALLLHACFTRHRTSESLGSFVYKPTIVLPLQLAQQALVLPQPNRYAPVCQPGTFRGPDDFLPCTPCVAGEFQEYAGKKSCELCPKNYYSMVIRAALLSARR